MQGLKNLGATCAINSLIQIICRNKYLRESIIDSDIGDNTFTIELKELLKIMHIDNNSVSPNKFITKLFNIFNDNFQYGQQIDITELYFLTFDKIFNETNISIPKLIYDKRYDNMELNDNLINALILYQLEADSLPNLGFHPIGDPPNVKWVKKPMDMDCKIVLKNMNPPDMSRWDAPLYAQNCNYYFRQNLFSGGVDDLQEIFNYWSNQPFGTYDLQPNGDDQYFISSLMAQLVTTYALFYEKFSNNKKASFLYSTKGSL